MRLTSGVNTTTVYTDHTYSISELKGSLKEANMFYIYDTEKITRKAIEAAEYIELFGSSARDRHARRIQCYSLNVRRYMRHRA